MLIVFFQGRVCEKITLPMCKGIGYNYTSMPNPLHHKTQADAALNIQQYIPLLQTGCSSSFRKFLCSVYAPRCTQTGGIMLPCRSLCEESKRGCEPLMNKFGFPWPTNLNCSSFPVEGGNRSCIAPDAQPGEFLTIRECLCKSLLKSLPRIVDKSTQFYKVQGEPYSKQMIKTAPMDTHVQIKGVTLEKGVTQRNKALVQKGLRLGFSI